MTADNMAELILGEYLVNTSLVSVFWFLLLNKNPEICPEWRMKPTVQRSIAPQSLQYQLTSRAKTKPCLDCNQETSESAEGSLPLGSSWRRSLVMTPKLPGRDDCRANARE